MLKSLPTMLWVIGATVAVAALSPVVGTVAPAAPAAVPPSASAPSPAPASEPPPSEPPATAQPSATGEAPVIIKHGTTKLGLVAVDADGMTLYMSVLDSRDPSKSVCVSKTCLAAWKPVYVKKSGIVAGAGVSQDKVGTVVRPDEDIQATLNGWPLYRFAKDTKPGDVLGEGVKGTWHVLSPQGQVNR
jgi:predicted lipoprotein with Yx(FWY)xxD motif